MPVSRSVIQRSRQRTLLQLGDIVLFPSDSIALDPEQAIRRMLTIRGLHNCLSRDLDDALRFLERNHQRFPFDSLVGKGFPLRKVEQAFGYAMEQRPVRVAVHPSSDA